MKKLRSTSRQKPAVAHRAEHLIEAVEIIFGIVLDLNSAPAPSPRKNAHFRSENLLQLFRQILQKHFINGTVFLCCFLFLSLIALPHQLFRLTDGEMLLEDIFSDGFLHSGILKAQDRSRMSL